MGLWMLLLLLLLLLLHSRLGNAPRMEEECVSLPAPSNVSISSFNMVHTLSFLPGPETPPDARFTVQILRRNSWKSVASCSELTAGQTCNLTRAFKDVYNLYVARVRAFVASQTSGWTESGPFQPLTDTVLGPPDVSVSGCGNCLLLRLTAPGELQQLRDMYRGLVLHVQRTRDGAQFTLNLPYKEESVITYLQPGVEYCVTVTVTALFNTHAVSSETYCAFTSPPPTRSSLTLVFSLLGVFCALGVLLTGLLVYGGRLRFELLRRHLTRTLSYVLLRRQNGGRAPTEEGSADCLLTDPRPVQTARSSSEGGEENCRLAVKSNI